MTSQPVAKVPDLTSKLNAPQSDPALYHLSQGVSGLLDALLDHSLDLMLVETDLPSRPSASCRNNATCKPTAPRDLMNSSIHIMNFYRFI